MRCSAPSLYELHGCSSKDNLNALNIQLNFEQIHPHRSCYHVQCTEAVGIESYSFEKLTKRSTFIDWKTKLKSPRAGSLGTPHNLHGNV